MRHMQQSHSPRRDRPTRPIRRQPSPGRNAGSRTRGSASAPILNAVLYGLLIALIVIVVEALIWLFLPFSSVHSLAALLAAVAQMPLLLLIPLAEIMIAVVLALLLMRPLALSRYCKDIGQASEHFRASMTPLPNWPSLYETRVSYIQPSPDPSAPAQARELTLLELLRGSPFQSNAGSHLVLQGEPGAGKSTALHFSIFHTLQSRRRIVYGRDRTPIYIPLRQYALYLEEQGVIFEDEQDQSTSARLLLDFLATSDLPGMHSLRPYLAKLAQQGRLLLLCDGLHEVDELYQSALVAELAEYMSQERNRVVLTCQEADLRHQPLLEQAIEANLVPRAVLLPLSLEQVRNFVEQYIEGESAGKRWRHTAGQVMEIISRTRLHMFCDNPFLLLALLGVIDGMGMERGKQLDTRGRLLRAYVGQRILQAQRMSAWNGQAPSENDLLLFLGELACGARWTNVASTIRLHERAHLLGGLFPSMEQHAEALCAWLDNRSEETFITDFSPEQRDPGEVARLLSFARDASLVEISPHGMLSFRHAFIAAYVIAEFFTALQPALDATLQQTRFVGLLTQAIKRQDTADGYSRWSLPAALWADLLDDAPSFAGRFGEYAREYPAAAPDALALSLLCAGAASYPPRVASPDIPPSPPLSEDLKTTLSAVMKDRTQRTALARIFTRHAEEGAFELYQSLFALLLVPGIDDLVPLLDMERVPSLLVYRLVDIVDDVAYETQVKRLVRLIGCLGLPAVPFAVTLSKSGVGRSVRLRTAAINILGGTGVPQAVAPLDACLYDADTFIVHRAASALYRLGPTLTLPALLTELDNQSQTSATMQVHAIALNILEQFLVEQSPARQMSKRQNQQVTKALMSILNQPYAPEIQERAREMLVRQGQTAEESAGGEMAVEALIQNLSIADEQLGRATVSALCDIGPAATPRLLKELDQQPAELVTTRIVETLGHVRDPRAMSPLLRLLSDPALPVQQSVAQALLRYGAESIPGLIYQALQGENELVATSAEQILSELGEDAVDPVIEALIPTVPGRTRLLVNVLARIHDPHALPTLIALLETSVSESPVDAPLVLALIEALGQFQDERAVSPLMEMLASTQPLFYEGAINALSRLELVACDSLIAALDVEQDTAIVQRVERTLLGMQQFPDEAFLAAFEGGSDAQGEHLVHVLLAKGPDAARFVVSNFLHPDRRVQFYTHEAAERMPGQVIVPALLESIDHPDRAWRAVIAEYLLLHPREAAPPLVAMLEEHERGALAQRLLLAFGPDILPELIPALDSLSDQARERARQLAVELARQSPETLMQVVQLFAVSPPPQRAHEALVDTLANELADISVPVLLDGLEDAHLVGVVSETLGQMVKKGDARSPYVMEALLEALRIDGRRQGAGFTLVDIGAEAVPGVGSLITDPDPAIAQVAQDILGQIGVPAFSFIWAAYSDVNHSAKREAARAIFRRMPTHIIKDELVELLSSNTPGDIAMALSLMLERIHDEALLPGNEHEMIPVLLEYIQTRGDERVSQRLLALLLLIGGSAVVDFIAQVLYEYPHHQPRLLHALLLLGEEAEETLLELLHDPNAPVTLRAEAAGMLGLLSAHPDVREYAKMLPEYGLWAGQSQGLHGALHPDQLNIALRALGGMLISGSWNAAELEQLRLQSDPESPEHELYAILMGWRYHPYIQMLEQQLEQEREENRQRILKLGQEIFSLRTERADLEEQLEGLSREHGKRGQELDEASRAIDDLRASHSRASQERDSLQRTLQGLRADKERLQEQLEQTTQEKQRIAARLTKLEQDLRSIGGGNQGR
jgi:HEAT repeat protein